VVRRKTGIKKKWKEMKREYDEAAAQWYLMHILGFSISFSLSLPPRSLSFKPFFCPDILRRLK